MGFMGFMMRHGGLLSTKRYPCLFGQSKLALQELLVGFPFAGKSTVILGDRFLIFLRN